MRDNDEWGGIAAIQVVPRVDPLGVASIGIQLDPSGTSATLSWPAGLGEVILEESADLQEWLPAESQPETNAITVPLVPDKRFYRLARP